MEDRIKDAASEVLDEFQYNVDEENLEDGVKSAIIGLEEAS